MRSETPITWYQVEGDPALDLRPQFILTADETTDLLDSHVASTLLRKTTDHRTFPIE